MFKAGCHISVAGGYAAMGRTALAIGANTFQYFTRNPRGRGGKTPSAEDVAALRQIMETNGFAPALAHAPYTYNPCSADAEIRAYTKEAMAGELRFLEQLPGSMYNFHPGCHVGQGVETGIRLIAETLDQVMFPEQKTTVLLETMAGKGTEIGGSFEELREILDRVAMPDRVGVCLDTCHVHDAGYDIAGNLDSVLTEFDRVIGLDKLKALHLNDSKNPLGARKDRHEKLGQGYLGLDALVQVVSHPALDGRPMSLETPNELDGYAEEIRVLRKLTAEVAV